VSTSTMKEQERNSPRATKAPSLSALLDGEECDEDVDVVDYHQGAQDGLDQDIVILKSTDHHNLVNAFLTDITSTGRREVVGTGTQCRYCQVQVKSGTGYRHHR